MKKEKSILKKLIISWCMILAVNSLWATGEPSTYFNIFIPPNAENIQRNVCLVVTAIYDSTAFSIVDDGMDGDTDDSKTGMLMAGQSYILYIKDNGINDDAKYASGGVLKQDGDYFIITANNLVYASQSTNSDWQHDWVPATNKTGIGQKFIIYAPKTSNSNRDLNVFAYQDNTQITIRKISTFNNLITGFTNVDMNAGTIVAQRNLNIGQDIIYSGSEGRDVMISGETYVVEANKPVTVQYGALYTNERDGGGYVPSSNGSATGDLFYFGVPYQSGTNGEQEIRVVSTDNANVVTLERYSLGTWVAMKTWTVNANAAVDWVGKNNGNVSYPTVFRVKCSAGKKVSVFEANWLETGNPGTSDIGTMCSSSNGTSSGKNFIIYLAPPGNEYNVKNPFTNALFNQQLTHAYLFANNDTCHVTVKDAYTNGTKVNKTYTILPGRYVDCYLTLTEWKSIYNNTGTVAGGPERPYISVVSDKPISVMNTNFNDNWMMYMGSSLQQNFQQTTSTTKSNANPGDTVTITTHINFLVSQNIDSATVLVKANSGLEVISSRLENTTTNTIVVGSITTQTTQTIVNYPVQLLLVSTNDYQIVTKVIPQLMYNNGNLVDNGTVIGVETIITGKVNGITQQSSSSTGVQVQSANTGNLLFSLASFSGDLTNSWTCNTVDIDNDGWEDLFVTDKDNSKPNLYYKNNGNKTFTKTNINRLTTDLAPTVCSSWADFNNDGKRDVFIVNNTQKANALFVNNGNLSFQSVGNTAMTNHVAYFHSGSFVDYDNDGFLDVFVSNFMPTKFNELYHNNGDGTFTQIMNGAIVSENHMSLGATWADFDNDGDQDLFVPNNNNENNSFFVNDGNGSFTKSTSLNITNDLGNSTGSCWGDVNNDGWLDLFVANASNQNNFLYINNKNGGFTKVTTGNVVNDGGHSHGCSFVDVDNDMDLDLYVTNDIGNKFLYINDGAGNFTRKKDEILEANYGKSMGQTWFDADKDGDMDLFVVTHSGQKNYFFTNNGNTNKWINIKLVGNISNKDAIGARVSIKSGSVWQCREVNSQSGLGGQHSIRCHFGLGANSTIDSVVVKWPSGIKQYVTGLSINAFNTITEPSGACVKGGVYYDENNNCVKDNNEQLIANIKVDLNAKYSVITNNDGKFKTHLPLATYSTAIANQNYWYNVCSSTTYSITNLTDTTILYLPVTSSVSNPDLKVDVSATAMRRGFKNQVNVTVDNLGSKTAYNVPLTLNLFSGMTLKSASPNYVSSNNNVYSWIIDSIKPGQSFAVTMLDSVHLSKIVGSTLQFEAQVILAADVEQSNNTSLKTMTVVGAIDPNDLKVSPEGESEFGYVKVETVLNYKIRFQNVGTYYAERVVITDVLPQGLNVREISNIQSSHHYQFNMIENGHVQFTFDNIHLPDSTTNEAGSHGFVSFDIPLLKTISEGTTIENEAFIQFDFEDVIKTNKVMNTVVLTTSDEFVTAYPNPANDKVVLQLHSTKAAYQSDNYIKTLSITNAQGNVVHSTSTETGRVEINTSLWSAGIYYATMTDAFGKQYHQKIVIVK